jgi:hypothetical protein
MGAILGALWVLLFGFHVVATFAFAGWVGIADGFIPWSLFALVLWWITDSWLGSWSVRRSTSVRVTLVLVWLTLLVSAVWGIDHRPSPVPAGLVVSAYVGFPIAFTLAAVARVTRTLLVAARSMPAAT